MAVVVTTFKSPANHNDNLIIPPCIVHPSQTYVHMIILVILVTSVRVNITRIEKGEVVRELDEIDKISYSGISR